MISRRPNLKMHLARIRTGLHNLTAGHTRLKMHLACIRMRHHNLMDGHPKCIFYNLVFPPVRH